MTPAALLLLACRVAGSPTPASEDCPKVLSWESTEACYVRELGYAEPDAFTVCACFQDERGIPYVYYEWIPLGPPRPVEAPPVSRFSRGTWCFDGEARRRIRIEGRWRMRVEDARALRPWP